MSPPLADLTFVPHPVEQRLSQLEHVIEGLRDANAALLKELRDMQTRFDRLELKVVRVEERQNNHGELGSTVDEHGQQLADHEIRLSNLQRDVGVIRQSSQAVVDNVERIADGLTAATGGLSRMEKLFGSERSSQERRDAKILAALDRVVEAHQPKVTL